MMHKASGAADDCDIARFQPYTLGLATFLDVSDPKESVITKRYRHDGPRKIGLVAILVQAHSGALTIKIDQTAIGPPLQPGECVPKVQNRLRDFRPAPALRMSCDVPISVPVRKPSIPSGRCHLDRQCLARPGAWRKQRCCPDDLPKQKHHLFLLARVQPTLKHLDTADCQGGRVRACGLKWVHHPRKTPFLGISTFLHDLQALHPLLIYAQKPAWVRTKLKFWDRKRVPHRALFHVIA